MSQAHAAYVARFQSIQELAKKLQEQLEAHSTRESRDERNWGFAGDLAHIEDLLRQATEFLETSGARR